MNILILGGGGREHAFAEKFTKSPHCKKLLVAPGNAGTAQIAENIDININDFQQVKKTVLENNVDIVVVGPEEPLVRGILDYFQNDQDLKGVQLLGPDKTGAQLEGSKDFSKDFMNRYGIPTAKSRTFTAENLNEGLAFLKDNSSPYVLKVDGLAAGKGVIITESLAEAKDTLIDILTNDKFGSAGNKVLIEQFLEGIELSVFVLSDGKDYVILPEAKDYKRIGESDTGLNTGGMGAVSPVPFATNKFMTEVEETIIKPTIAGLQKENIVYKGFIFFGLMKVGEKPYVIEYNVRMGDPETEVVFPRINTDILSLIKGALDGDLDKATIDIDDDYAVTTMVVSGGYPEVYKKGAVMKLPETKEDSLIYHAGTKLEGNSILTNGGRVIALTGKGKSLDEAIQNSREMASKVEFENKYFRKDIGEDLKNFI